MIHFLSSFCRPVEAVCCGCFICAVRRADGPWGGCSPLVSDERFRQTVVILYHFPHYPPNSTAPRWSWTPALCVWDSHESAGVRFIHMWPLSPANTLLPDNVRQSDWCHHDTLRRTDNYFPMVLYDESLTAVVQFNAMKLQRNAFIPTENMNSVSKETNISSVWIINCKYV